MSGVNYSSGQTSKAELQQLEIYTQRASGAPAKSTSGANAVETVPRLLNPGGTAQSVTLGGATVTLQYFIAPTDYTFSSFVFNVATAGAGSPLIGSGYVRIGLYVPSTYNGDSLTLVARSVSGSAQVTGLSGTGLQNWALDSTGGYPASYGLLAGQQYAIVFLNNPGTAFTTTAPALTTAAIGGTFSWATTNATTQNFPKGAGTASATPAITATTGDLPAAFVSSFTGVTTANIWYRLI